ncbi:unnamed protein product [Rotaria sp. Silwood1]|nr:unnamed protein product [Rotaria sp. Silwood1]
MKTSLMKSKQNITELNIISEKYDFIVSSIILNITDLYETDNDRSCIDIISPILSMTSITCLNITVNEIFIGTLINMRKCLPNLNSLIISSLAMIQPRCLSIEETRIFCIVLNNNKIIKDNLKQISDLAQVQFTHDLCPHMKYFQIDCINGVCPEYVKQR